MKQTILSIFFLSFFFNLFSQPINDDCSGIVDLGVAPICPFPDTFNNVNATLSMAFSSPIDNVPSCFNGGTVDRDVWFQFTVPIDIVDFTINVTGVNGLNGSITQPQIAIYRGDCLVDELVELNCATSNANSSVVTIDLLGLTPNLTYFLRINDWSINATPNWGDFVVCIEELSQTYIMGTDLTSNTCSGTLFDSGGPDNEYQVDEDFTFTICPDILTNCINLELVNYNIENSFDFLTFYAGDDINAPEMANFTGAGDNIYLQAGSNCVTIQFTSDFIITAPGFQLNWQCSPDSCMTTFVPCQETTNIFGLPFTENGVTTCNSGDDVQSGPCANSDALLEGEDFVYTYNPFNDACIDIIITGADLNTGLSVYNDCPESASDCMGFAQNTTNDSLIIQGISLTAFDPIFIVISNANCTDFNIQIVNVACPVTAPARPICDDALLLNNCEGLPDAFAVGQTSLSIPEYFQVGVNDGCWTGTGAAHYTWLFFQAQADGDFGFIAENGNEFEASNLNIQVWGPIPDFEMMCDFMENNQPLRSTAALNTLSSMTGLTNLNPLNNMTVSDDCEGDSGDGFVSAMPVQNGEIYLVFINDFDGNIVNGGVTLDFSPTTVGVLNGLPEDTPLSADEYTLIGDAVYTPYNFDYSCIQITPAQNTQKSCVWAAEQVSFFEPFSQNITVYLGDNDGGADGICMVYHQSVDGANACGVSGGQIGAGSIDNSFIIEFDTWQNVDLGDPFQDHIAVNINGDMGNPIGGPAVLPNIEDGQEHIVTFNWDPTTMTYEIFFDGTLQISGVYDIVQNCFQGISTAYCGFTGSTGGANNLQYACTGDNLYPTASLDSIQVEICQGESYFAGGADQTQPGVYTDAFVKLNGCDSTIVTELSVTAASSDSVEVVLCKGQIYFVGGAAQSAGGIYVDTLQTAIGCDSIVTTDLMFVEFLDSLSIQLCEGETYFAQGQNQTQTGVYTDIFTSQLGCDSVIISNVEFVSANVIIEPADPLDCENGNCTTLDASNSTIGDNVTYNWTALGQSTIEDGQNTLTPTICGAGVYLLEVTNTINGFTCVSTDTIEIFVDETIVCEYQIPNAFTPDGDEMNDFFQLIDEGENFEVISLSIFNRWGETVHEGSGNDHFWDGTLDGKPSPSDVYVYYFKIRAIATGELFEEDGELTLLR
jgi:gliding motility-associated-like protein